MSKAKDKMKQPLQNERIMHYLSWKELGEFQSFHGEIVKILHGGVFLKELNLLVWLTQLGMNVVLPLCGFVCLAEWLRVRFAWGVWATVLGVALGVLCAADGLRSSLKMMERMVKDKKKETPPAAFNEHE